MKKSRQDLAAVQKRAAEEHAKVASLQKDNNTLRLAAQQAGEVQVLKAEVQRLQHLELERDRFDAAVQDFRNLKVDVCDLGIFRKNKVAILRYLKLLPKVIE